MTDAPAPHQLPEPVVEFATELRALIAGLDPGAGWYAVFAQRDPQGIRACLTGREIPPWDVVEALLQDLTAQHGRADAAPCGERLRQRYVPAVRAYDRQICGRGGLQQRLGTMCRVRDAAHRRIAELSRAVGEGRTAYGDALAWARDDFARAHSRCAELRSRLAELPPAEQDPAAPGAAVADAVPPAPTGVPAPAPDHPAAEHPDASAPAPPPVRRVGSRGVGRSEPSAAPQATAPALPTLPAAAGRSPRGARFAGAYTDPEEHRPRPAPLTAQDREAVTATVARLVDLRAAGSGGLAYVLLCEAAQWHAARLPALAGALERVGLGNDVALLLWELATAPPARLAEVAAAFALAGRDADCGTLLRQSAARPVVEVAETAGALCAVDRREQAEILLAALLRARTVEETVPAAELDGGRLAPVLLAAAESVSAQHRRAVAGLLRRAG